MRAGPRYRRRGRAERGGSRECPWLRQPVDRPPTAFERRCISARPLAAIARHNREGVGEDQLGYRYRISYQPDWLRTIRVTCRLPSGQALHEGAVPQPGSASARQPPRTRADQDRESLPGLGGRDRPAHGSGAGVRDMPRPVTPCAFGSPPSTRILQRSPDLAVLCLTGAGRPELASQEGEAGGVGAGKWLFRYRRQTEYGALSPMAETRARGSRLATRAVWRDRRIRLGREGGFRG